MALGWFYSPSQIGRYIVSRVTSLAPPKVGLCVYGQTAMDLVLMLWRAEQIAKSSRHPARAHSSPMAHVRGRFHGLDLGCF